MQLQLQSLWHNPKYECDEKLGGKTVGSNSAMSCNSLKYAALHYAFNTAFALPVLHFTSLHFTTLTQLACSIQHRQEKASTLYI